MDAALAASLTELLKMGLAGIVIIGLGVSVITLYRAKEKQAEDRLNDMRALLTQCTTALLKGSDSMDSSTESLKGVQAALTNLVATLERRR